MIDFIKFQLVNSSSEQLEANPYLEFKTLVSTDTGDVSRFKKAYYKSNDFIKFAGVKERIDFLRDKYRLSENQLWQLSKASCPFLIPMLKVISY